MSVWTCSDRPGGQAIAREISALLGSRPLWGAPAEELAVWFGRKAEMFERIAEIHATDGDPVRANEALVAAAQARNDAVRVVAPEDQAATQEVPEPATSGDSASPEVDAQDPVDLSRDDQCWDL